MKRIKYLVMGALLLGTAMPAMAQDDVKSQIAAITNAIKADPTGAAAQVKDFYKKNKKNPEALVGLGRAYLAVKDTANARKYGEEAIKRDKKYTPGYILLGDNEVIKDDGGAAAAWYQQATYFDPTNPEGYIKYANIYRGRSPEEAVAKLEEMRTNIPGYPVDAAIGHIYSLSGKVDKAVSAYDKADISKLDDDALAEYAFSAWLTQDFNKSLNIVNQGLARKPKSVAFNRIAFYDYTNLKDYDNAEKYADILFNECDSAKFTFTDYLNHGYAVLGNKKYDAAIESFQKVLDEKPDYIEAYKQIAEAYKGKQDYNKAIEYYQTYLDKLEKKEATDVAALAQLYEDIADSQTGDERMQSLKMADATYDALINQFEHAAIYGNFRRAILNQSKIDENDVKKGSALPHYTKMAELIEAKADKDATDKARLIAAYQYIGYYKLLNDAPDYKEYWQKVYDLDPTNENAKKVLDIK